jgi:hypothetical protein
LLPEDDPIREWETYLFESPLTGYLIFVGIRLHRHVVLHFLTSLNYEVLGRIKELGWALVFGRWWLYNSYFDI